MDTPEPAVPPKERRTLLLLGGGAAALVAGVALALGLAMANRGERMAPPPASRGGLIIDPAAAPSDGRIDAAKPLRCFVAGQFVGELALTDCARRNGVATDALDVGVDETGALAAAEQGGQAVTPLPPEISAQPAPADAADAADAAQPSGPCWRHAEGQWRRLADQTLDACVQTLFAGRCERPGGASYGRWMQQTLRLTAGRVESSADNRSFATLAEQGPGCAVPPVR